MTDTPATRKLRALITAFGRRRPIRAGALIVTIYGDAIAPRGGSLWLGSLLDMMDGFGIEPDHVRTAVSRLVADGWLDRSRIGKRSYYRLAAERAAGSAEANARIYRADEPPWFGAFDVAVLVTPDEARRGALREELLRRGFGQASPTVMVRPCTAGTRDAAEIAPGEVVRMSAQLDGASSTDAGLLATACWQLDDLHAAYSRFVTAFTPIAADLDAGVKLEDAHAFQLRILLIHDWRRIVLRDPLLPGAMLPDGWPGAQARALVTRMYARTLAASERWLSHHAVEAMGPLPPADKGELSRRFGKP